MTKRLLQIYLDIVLLRKGPQHLPSSKVLSLGSLLAYFLATRTYLWLLEKDAALANEWGFISTGLIPLTLAVLLFARRLLPRFHQTLAALAGTSALLTLVMLPIDLSIVASQAGGGAVAAPVVLGWLAMVGWSFVLDAHIFRHALSVSFTTGMLVTVILFGVSRFVLVTYLGGNA